jgi:hypothetical protein
MVNGEILIYTEAENTINFNSISSNDTDHQSVNNKNPA